MPGKIIRADRRTRKICGEYRLSGEVAVKAHLFGEIFKNPQQPCAGDQKYWRDASIHSIAIPDTANPALLAPAWSVENGPPAATP
jgi:hypothetical protein